ncbi:MAG: hypothetical protein ACLRM9_04265 [Collinsella aerofaciens]
MTMVHLSDVVVMKVSNTVLKHKHATRNTLARNRMLARLTETAKQGALLATHDNTELMWLRRHVGTDDIAEPEPYLFCFQHDWDALTPAERALRTIKGLAEFHPDWAFWGYDAALLWGLEVPNDLLGPRFLVKTCCSVTLSSGCRLLRPQMAGALERVGGVRVTPFWRTVEDCLLRAPFSYGLAIADSALRAKGMSRDDLCDGSGRLRGQARVSQGTGDCVVCGRAVRKTAASLGSSVLLRTVFSSGLQVEFRDPLDPSRCFASTIFGGSRTGRVSSASSTEGSTPCRTARAGSRSTHSWQNVGESHLTMLGHKGASVYV